MNNKIFLKIACLFIIGLLGYLFFVVFFLSPKLNSYLVDTEIKNSKIQFNKIVSTINNQSEMIESKDLLLSKVRLLLTSTILGKSGYIYIFDSTGKVIFDPSGEIEAQNISTIVLPSANNTLLFNEIKKAFNKGEVFEYDWNRVSDPNNYKYKKFSWIEYNQKLDWYITSSIYKEDFSSFVEDINSLILNTSILLFAILSVIGIFIIIKIILPINKMFIEVENNKKTFDEDVQIKMKEIQDRLYYDELTTLKNRTALEDDIKDDDFVSIALVDIDSFDDINELYGFSIGNILLIEVAKILNDFSLKHNVKVYRFYGNVYCLADNIMMGFTRYDEFISELCKLFKNRPIHIKELSSDLFINITLGISIAQEEPIKTAGIALKKAKKANMRFFVYNNEINTKDVIEKSIYWQEKIKLAIKEDNVVPFYQPIFNRNNQIVKYETLMRIRDKNDNGEIIFLSPYLFLDVSIKTKQYLQLSNQVISKAFEDLSKTNKQVSLNLSFKDILDGDFITSLDEKLEKIDNKKKEQIVFEILESDFISDYALLEDFIIKYRNQGIKIAIDDFGTGYSNFSHILKIRPNYIKIDGSLIKNINTDKNSYEMLKSIITFSKALNIKVIAEFVHSKEVYDIIFDLGIDEFQGFYLGEPSENIE